MPQYPIPPWPPRPENEPPSRRRRTRLNADNPRYTDLPLVEGTPDGTIRVLRGAQNLADLLAARAESKELFDTSTGAPGVPHLVAWNRLDRLAFFKVGQLLAVGHLEFALYTAPYMLSPDVAAATTLEELRAAYRAELKHLDVLEADGWKLSMHYGHVDRQILVDTRRPDERLTARDLP